VFGDKMDDLSKTKKIWEQVQQDPELDKQILLGRIGSHSLSRDPKHLEFTLSRYKFAAKMLHDRKKIVDIGCGEGIGCLMLKAETKARITGIDFDPEQIFYAKKYIKPLGGMDFICQDLINKKIAVKKADGLVSIDVIEHIHPDEQSRFLSNIVSCLTDEAVAVFGTPSIYSQKHMSKRSRIGHINLYDEKRLKDTLLEYFRYVFVFSMNDEMVHTGYAKMAHYFLALCCK
jgi:cyclopropane fatty-acyl-phospholipid synthase-like methyltransferase